MSGDATSTDTRPWRKRHPVLSRSILYVLGLGLAALLAVLYMNRKDEDEATELEALGKQLNDLSIVMAMDPDGKQVLRILDENFSDADLPVDMQGRALRWRALAHRRGGNHAKAAAAFDAANKLDLPKRERLALNIEWAEALAESGKADEALQRLQPLDPIDGPLGLLRDFVYVQVQLLRKQEPAAVRHLQSALAGLAAPLPADQDYVGGRPWTASQVATVMTELLVTRDALDTKARIAAWRRLAQLAAGDFEAQIATARGFLGLALARDARKALARAEVLDPRQAAAVLRSDPVLARIKDRAD